MNEQENFDDILRSKLNERDFPFDEHNWEKAEAKIERSEKRRRYGLIAAIFAAGILVGAGIMYPFINSNKSEAISTVQPIQQPIVLTNQNTTPGTSSTNQAATSRNENNTAANNPQPVASPSNINTGNNIPVVAHNNNATVSLSQPGKKHKKNITAKDTATQYAYVRPESTKKKKHQKAMPPEYAAALVNNNVPANYKNGTQPANETNVATQPASVQNNNIQTQPNSSVPANTTNNVAATTVAKPSDTANHTTIASTPVKAKTDSSTSTTLSSSNSSQPPKQASKKYSHTLLSIDAGAGYSFGWMKEGGTQGNGISPVLGISATHYFSTKVSALMGIQYNSLTNMNTLYSSSNTQYDFGATNNVNSVTLKTLYYLAVPLKFQYNLNANNIIGIGCDFVYLLNTSSSVVSYQQNYFGVSGNTASTKTGYMDGVNPFDAQLTLAYRRKVNRFTLGVEGYYGLLDIEDNSFFDNNIFERNSGLRFILSYDFIK